MGCVYAEIDLDFNVTDWILADKLDIRELCLNCNMCKCNLHHDKTFSDYIDHFIMHYKHVFDQCDFIIIERQPPTGFISIQELILHCFRSKTILVSPNSVHKFHNIQHYDYEGRKKQSIILAQKHMGEHFYRLMIGNLTRQHDVTDAVCQMLFWLDKQKKPDIFKQFAYKPIITDFTKYNYNIKL